MKQLFLLAASLLLLAGCAASPDSGPEAPAARALAERVLGKDARHFVFRTIDADSDVFRIETQGRKTVFSGNNANSMAVGLNHYLKYFCNVNVGWFVWDEVVLPEKFPVVAEPIEIKARVEERFFLNYCTFGYTMHGGTGTSGSISSTGWPSTG